MADRYILPSDREPTPSQPVQNRQPSRPYRLPSEGPEQPSTFSDVAKAVPSALVKGTLGIAGLPGDIKSLWDKAFDYLGHKAGAATRYATGRASTWEQAQQQEAEGERRFKAAQQKYRAASPIGRALNVVEKVTNPPTSEDFISGYNKALGAVTKPLTGTAYTLYNPKTTAGRLTQDVVSMLPAAALGPEKLAVNLVKNLPGALGSSLAAGTTREMLGPENPISPYAEFVAGILGGAGGIGLQRAAQARSAEAALERGRRAASVVAKEAYVSPETVSKALGTEIEAKPTFAGKAPPTTAQTLSRTPGEAAPSTAALQRTLEKANLPSSEEGLAGAFPEQPDLAEAQSLKEGNLPASAQGVEFQQEYANKAGKALEDALESANQRQTDMQAATGVEQGVQGNASSRVKDMLTSIEQGHANTAENAWSQVERDAQLNGAPVLNDLKNHIGNLNEADKLSIPGTIKRVLRNLDEKFGTVETGPQTQVIGGVPYEFDRATGKWTNPVNGRTVSGIPAPEAPPAPEPLPLDQLQSFRSSVLGEARAASRAGQNNKARVLNGLASKIADNMGNPENYVSGGENATEAWDAAVAATRKLKENFGSGFAQKAVERDENGAHVISGEALVDKMLSGQNGIQNLRNVRDIEGVDKEALDSAVSDWMVGKLTKNGTNHNLTEKEVSKFVNDPRHAPVIEEVPQLKQRMENIAKSAVQNDRENELRSIAAKGNKAIMHPDKFIEFMDKHGEDLRDLMPPEQREALEHIYNSAKYLEKIPGGSINSGKALEYLRKGDILGLLYGRAADVVSDTATLTAFGKAFQGIAHVASLGHGIPLVGPAALVFRRALPSVQRYINNAIFGKTSEYAAGLLHAAVADPKVMKALLETPTPDNMNKLVNTLASSGKVIAKLSAYGEAKAKSTVPEPETGDAFTLGQDYAVPEGGQEEFFPDYGVPEEKPQRATGGRVAFATGGKIKKASHEELVQRLINKAKQAKKQTDSTTKPLLNVDDAAIVKALSVAQRGV